MGPTTPARNVRSLREARLNTFCCLMINTMIAHTPDRMLMIAQFSMGESVVCLKRNGYMAQRMATTTGG